MFRYGTAEQWRRRASEVVEVGRCLSRWQKQECRRCLGRAKAVLKRIAVMKVERGALLVEDKGMGRARVRIRITQAVN